MIEWNYIVIGLCLLLVSFLLYGQLTRQNKTRLTWRVLATILAVASLACMILPVTYHQDESIATNREAVLLTEGFNSDSVKKFLSGNSNEVPVVITEKNLKGADHFNASYLPGAAYLPDQYKNVQTFHVFGYGLEKDELNSLKNFSVVFHPSEIATGITAINWNRKINIAEKLFIQGTVNNTSSSKAKLVLSSFNTTLDSVVLSPGKDQKFELITIPKHEARSVYTITLYSGKDVLEQEVAPVQVVQGEPLKVLLLSSSPNFESKFLKDLLSQKGFTVVSRTTISKNKFVKDFLNTAAIPVDRITPALLEKFDLTIADATELKSIPTSDLAAIKSQVDRKSMGLIVRADSAAGSSFYGSMFPLTAGGNSPAQINLSFSDSTGNMPPITSENLTFIRNHQGTLPLVADKQSRTFAAISLYGSGKIILTTLANTYSWALAGFQNEYYSFWSRLLNKATKKSETDEAWSVAPALPEVNKLVQLQLQTNRINNLQGQLGPTAVYLAQNVHLPYRWTGTYYPTKVGWQTGIQMNGSSFYWYAFNKNDWKNIRAFEKIVLTRKFADDNVRTRTVTEKEVKTFEWEVPKWIFFMTFLLFASYLWLENKLT